MEKGNGEPSANKYLAQQVDAALGSLPHTRSGEHWEPRNQKLSHVSIAHLGPHGSGVGAERPWTGDQIVQQIGARAPLTEAHGRSTPRPAMVIQWTQEAAHKKKFEHYSELEQKLTQARHATKVPEVQKALHGTSASIPAAPAAPAVSGSAQSKNAVNYKPHSIIKAGFSHSPDLLKPSPTHDHARDLHLVDKYKFLKYPEPPSTSILFHSLQGDLLRKRHTMTMSRPNQGTLDQDQAASAMLGQQSASAPAVGLEAAESEPSSTRPVPTLATPYQAPFPSEPTMPDRNDSATEISGFYQSVPSPSLIDKLSMSVSRIFRPEQPTFWKVAIRV
ncbi:hypothetical protein HDU91_001567 [Kappamyces sp. JEL0680]|nr:hypothetical protein HDU91_001567 [Kappamyces sp. JEL0680]